MGSFLFMIISSPLMHDINLTSFYTASNLTYGGGCVARYHFIFSQPEFITYFDILHIHAEKVMRLVSYSWTQNH